MKVINYKNENYFIVQVHIDKDSNDLQYAELSSDYVSNNSIDVDINILGPTSHFLIRSSQDCCMNLKDITEYNLSKDIILNKNIKLAILNMNNPNIDIIFICKLLILSKGNYEVTEE